ncbi:Peptidase S10 [Theobroma cacao]|nr:Peptidase S10 [Theobroma cacao]
MRDLIEKLPGQPNVTFRQFSGYIDVDEKTGRSLFYYFVEAEKDPMNLPLTVWLTGGPGCGSVGDGFLSVGPFITTANAHGLQRNPYSWIKGHFIPNFANALVDYNKQSNNFKFNVKGLALDTLAVYDFFWSRGMININLHQQILKECNGIDEDNYSNDATKWTSGLKYNDVDKDIDMLPALKKILQQSIPITIFSGNQDAIVPIVGTLNHVNKLAKDMNLNLTKDEAWNHDNKGEGWMYSYGNLLTFMTVKGANHHVTFSKSSDALFIFTNVVLNRSH